MRNTPGTARRRYLKSELKELYERTRNELALLSEITHAMMQSLELEQVLFTILSALTSHEGLGFDRAMIFLVDRKRALLNGKMAIGPFSFIEACRIWDSRDTRWDPKHTFDDFKIFKASEDTKLNDLVKNISIPLREDMGVLAMTALEGMPFRIVNNEGRSRVNRNIRKLLNIENFISVPLRARDHTLGVILVDNPFSGRPVTQNRLRILSLFADHAALAIENSRLYGKTVHLSRTDWMTGLWNTRHFNCILEDTLETAAEENTSVCLLMADIDNFKKYNDTLGHQEGDIAIKRVAGLLDKYSRDTDIVCRYGGEEFCILMSGVDKIDARAIAERLRAGIEKAFREDDTVPQDLKLTISIGLSLFPADSGDKKILMRKADLALYHSKKNGKNKVCVYTHKMKTG